MLRANYHTHTRRCGHADGDDEDYVLEALGSGLTELGFSDHIMLPGFSQPNIRGDYSLCSGYINSIDTLRQKYRNRLHIYCGFEAEALPEFFPYYRELIDNKAIDYLILGNHFSLNGDHSVKTNFGHTPTIEAMYEYRDMAIEALRTGLFSCLAHPDYFMSEQLTFGKEATRISKDIIETCMALNIPLEINVAGIRNGKKRMGTCDRYIYPTDEFFALAGKMGAPCIIGIDAHTPSDLASVDSNLAAIRFAKKHSLKLLERLPFTEHPKFIGGWN